MAVTVWEGTVKLQNPAGHALRVAYSSAVYTGLQTDSGGDLTIAPTGTSTRINSLLKLDTGVEVSAGAGDMIIPFDASYRAVNSVGDDTLPLMSHIATNVLGLGRNTNSSVWGFKVHRMGTASFPANETICTIAYHDGTSVKEGIISIGAADSAGVGFRTLRVPN